jgi:hypothetical protein
MNKHIYIPSMLSKEEYEKCFSSVSQEKWSFINTYDRKEIQNEFAPTNYGSLNNSAGGRFFINLSKDKDINDIFKNKIEDKIFKNIKIMATFGVALFSETNSQTVYPNKDGIHTFIYNMNNKWASDMKGRLVIIDDSELKNNPTDGNPQARAIYVDPKPNSGVILYPEHSFFEEAYGRLFNALKISLILKFKEVTP